MVGNAADQMTTNALQENDIMDGVAEAAGYGFVVGAALGMINVAIDVKVRAANKPYPSTKWDPELGWSDNATFTISQTENVASL